MNAFTSLAAALSCGIAHESPEPSHKPARHIKPAFSVSPQSTIAQEMQRHRDRGRFDLSNRVHIHIEGAKASQEARNERYRKSKAAI